MGYPSALLLASYFIRLATSHPCYLTLNDISPTFPKGIAVCKIYSPNKQFSSICCQHMPFSSDLSNVHSMYLNVKSANALRFLEVHNP